MNIYTKIYFHIPLDSWSLLITQSIYGYTSVLCRWDSILNFGTKQYEKYFKMEDYEIYY